LAVATQGGVQRLVVAALSAIEDSGSHAVIQQAIQFIKVLPVVDFEIAVPCFTTGNER
jgi:hypothetical protein